MLLCAEDDLRSAHDGIREPDRTFFFGEASLAHETACALRDLKDEKGAVGQFGRSVRTRGAAFKRTHAVTLGYLGATQLSAGNVVEACATWSRALDAMEDGGRHLLRSHPAARDEDAATPLPVPGPRIEGAVNRIKKIKRQLYG
ncbi:hypothetical protein ACIQJT_40700 [Streptomyces sp. NPDC091972]|uniref:hypothetical protein n=1 Tax=Streptomyces sp. NPDC091972 TaxID=3366007 RepID=UPI003809EBD3